MDAAATAVPGLKGRFLALVPSAVPYEPAEAEAVKDNREKRRKRDRDPSSPDEARARGAELVFPVLADCPLYKDDTGASYGWFNGKLQLLDTKNREFAEDILYHCSKPSGAGCPSKEAVNTAISYY